MPPPDSALRHGFSVKDHFLTEAYLQAPGSGVQPAAQGSETSAAWTGKAIAFEDHAGSPFRGYEIGRRRRGHRQLRRRALRWTCRSRTSGAAG